MIMSGSYFNPVPSEGYIEFKCSVCRNFFKDTEVWLNDIGEPACTECYLKLSREQGEDCEFFIDESIDDYYEDEEYEDEEIKRF